MTPDTDHRERAVPQPAPARPRTLRAQRPVNLLVRGLLRTPLLCRLVGRRLMTIYVVGRISGRRYAVPVAYTPQGGSLLVGSSFAWLRNLNTGSPVAIRLRGRHIAADVEVLVEHGAVVAACRAMCRANHAFARFNAVGFDSGGEPREADLQAAWTAGARAARLTSR